MDLFHWERFEPNIGDNRALPVDQRFFLEVACGLSKVEMKQAKRAIDFTSLSPNVAECTALAQESKAEDETHAEALERVVFEQVNELSALKISDGWSRFFRMGTVSLTIDGKPIENLLGYMRCIIQQEGRYNVIEMAKTLARLNSVEGSRELF